MSNLGSVFATERSIVAVNVEKKTTKFVTIRKVKVPRIGVYISYHETFENAKAFAIEKSKENMNEKIDELKRATGQLELAFMLENPIRNEGLPPKPANRPTMGG